MRDEMIPKLRAWDKQDERMSYGEIEYFDDSINYRFDHFCTGADEDVEFMQSTGLKDKNDTEIYEGDIVILQEGHSSYYIVEWHDGGMWVFRYMNDKKQYYALNTILDFLDYSSFECKVIGNIYENPELFKGAGR